MVFFVYLDPRVLGDARKGGVLGLEAMTSVLRAMLQNCILLDFDDWRWETAVKRALQSDDGSFDLSLVKKLLVHLKKKHRVVPYFTDDYSGADDMQIVVAQSTAAEIDMILVCSTGAHSAGAGCEVADLQGYQQTTFEETRADAAANGREYSGGELAEGHFLDLNFRKLLKFASRVEICDAIFGRKFADSYEYSIKALLALMGGVLADPDHATLTIHCEQSNRNGHLLTQLATHRPAALKNLTIEVCFYKNSAGGQCLPHERYLVTDQVALELGRGMDFLDKATGTNRDLSISLKDSDRVRAKIGAYAAFASAPVVVA
jgi:hypothetical protein